jgi:hypothetical protein
MSSTGAASHAAVPVSHARAEASRRNGAKSRGPRTEAGKARASRNALKHGLRAQKHLVLPEEDAAGFAEHEAALLAELAPVARSRPCWRAASWSPAGASRAPIASRSSCSRSSTWRTAASGSR